MAWGAKSTLTGLNVSLSETTNADADYVAANHASEYVTLTPGESAHLQIEAAFGATGADMAFRIMGTLDDSSEAVDNLPFSGGSLAYTASVTVRRSIIVTGPYKFRVEVRKYGTTAGAYTPNVFIRKNGINV